MTNVVDKAAGDVVIARSWFRRNLVKLHVSALLSGWGVFEWLAPYAANRVHQLVLHIFWGGFVHKVLHIGYHVADNAAKK